jgi:hypothetical protein
MWRSFLSSRWCVPFAVIVGMLLVAPAVNIGLVADDYIHWAILTGQSPQDYRGSFWGLFTFFDGKPESIQALKDSGRLVWWASDVLRLSFWRPLSEFTHWLDYVWWPRSTVLMHVHNLLWYGLMVYCVGVFYRRLDTDVRQANLATLLFAGNFLHVFAVAWIASRNQMIAGVCMLLSLIAFHAWRSQGRWGQGVLAGVALLLGLLSAEAAIATGGYMAAYMVTIEQRSTWRARALALLPYVLLVLVWKAVHSHLGYGSTGSPAYIDPAMDLGRFAHNLVLRLPALMAAQWFGASTGVFEQFSEGTKVLYAAGAYALLAGLAFLFHRVGGFKSPLARFHVLGSVLVLLPACATLTMDRLVLNANVGMSAFLAIVICRVWAERDTLLSGLPRLSKYVVYGMAVLHLVLFPVAALVSSLLMKTMLWPVTVEEPLALPDARKLPSQHVILLNPPVPEMVFYYPLARAFHGVANPATMRVLGTGAAPSTLSRPDDTTLLLDVPEGLSANMARDAASQPFRPGDTATMGDIRVEVREVTSSNLPSLVVFRFPSSLSVHAWQFYAWKGLGYVAIEPPAVGQSIAFPRIDLVELTGERLKKND